MADVCIPPETWRPKLHRETGAAGRQGRGGRSHEERGEVTCSNDVSCG